MKNYPSFFLLFLLSISFYFSACCGFVPPVPSTSCGELQARTDTLDDWDIVYFDEEVVGSDSTALRRAIKRWQNKKIKIDSDPDSVFRYVGEPRFCPCDSTMMLMQGNPIVNPNDRRSSATDGDPDEEHTHFGPNLNFPVPKIDTNQNINFANQDFPGSSDLSPIVAIIDAGIDSNHPFFANVLWQATNPLTTCEGMKTVGYDFYTQTWPPKDESGHGTHVAGITAYQSQDVKILSLKMTYQDPSDPDRTRGDLFAALCALKTAIKQGAKVVNCSWGYYASDPHPTLLELVRLAQRKNILIVASAGNDSTDTAICPHWPSNFSYGFNVQDEDPLVNVISVGALNQARDALASYSNYGVHVQVMAPGTNIISTSITTDISTTPVTAFCAEGTGTSMAAPFITGAAIRSLASSPADIFVGDLVDEIRDMSEMEEALCDMKGAVSWDLVYTVAPADVNVCN